jgi:hypothetical protein
LRSKREVASNLRSKRDDLRSKREVTRGAKGRIPVADLRLPVDLGFEEGGSR